MTRRERRRRYRKELHELREVVRQERTGTASFEFGPLRVQVYCDVRGLVVRGDTVREAEGYCRDVNVRNINYVESVADDIAKNIAAMCKKAVGEDGGIIDTRTEQYRARVCTERG